MYMEHVITHLSVQCGLFDINFACLFIYSKHVACAFRLLTDDAVGDLCINCSSLVIIFPLDLHNKGSCSGSQQDKAITK